MTKEHLIRLKDMLIDGMQMPITIFGFTFDWWSVMLFEIFICIAGFMIYEFIFDD